MKKRHYLLLSDALRAARPIQSEFELHSIYLAHRNQWRHDCLYVANALESDASSFDKALFLTNVGVGVQS